MVKDESDNNPQKRVFTLTSRVSPLSPVFLLRSSLPASSPFGGHREKYTRERHARGDATAASRGFAACSRVLARLASFTQIGELASRLTTEIHYT